MRTLRTIIATLFLLSLAGVALAVDLQDASKIPANRPDVPHIMAPNGLLNCAGAIEVDPTFAAQIMRLANSAYYGMSGKVGNTGFAVSVIGFAAVRSMAPPWSARCTRPSSTSPAAGSSAIPSCCSSR